jgi:hypothetical protein
MKTDAAAVTPILTVGEFEHRRWSVSGFIAFDFQKRVNCFKD